MCINFIEGKDMAENQESAPKPEQEEAIVKNGDLIYIDYIAKLKTDGKIFDTTIEKVAKEANIYNADEIYSPLLVAVGSGWVIKGLDEALVGMKKGETKTIEVPPEKAYGERNPKLRKTVSHKEIRKQGVTPQIGVRVRIGDKYGTIVHVGAGRVIVDMNPPLAGKTLVYEITVKDIITEPKDKIMAFIKRNIPAIDKETVKIDIKDNIVEIELPTAALLAEHIQYAKVGIASSIFKYLENIEEVLFIDRIKK